MAFNQLKMNAICMQLVLPLSAHFCCLESRSGYIQSYLNVSAHPFLPDFLAGFLGFLSTFSISILTD